jgi:prolyl-tRNA synthetase
VELLGFPYSITVGRGAADGMVKYAVRKDDGKDEVSVADAVAKLRAALGR